jgi:phosphatidate cytidylyltransferase
MHNPPAVLYVVGGIWALLCVGTALVFAITRLQPDKEHRGLVQRTRSWWVMIGLSTFALLSSRWVMLCFLAFISFLALKEFFSSIPTRRADRRLLFWAYLAILPQYYWAGMRWYGMFLIFIPVYMFLFISFRMVLSQSTQGFLKAAASIHWGLMACVFALSHLAYLEVLPKLPVPGSVGGIGLLLYLVFLTELNDVAQYVWGNLFGRHKILSIISPKKTWEGLVGGVLTTTGVALLVAPCLTPFDRVHALFAGLLIGIFGFVGDVSISAVKRDMGVKDMGNLIPGHGGIMDRVDSLIFTAPLFFHFVYFFYY